MFVTFGILFKGEVFWTDYKALSEEFNYKTVYLNNTGFKQYLVEVVQFILVYF